MLLEDVDVRGIGNVDRGKDALIAIVTRPVELTGVHGGRRALEHSENAHALVERQARMRLRDLHEDIAAGSIQPDQVITRATRAVTTCFGGIGRIENGSLRMRGS
jgi:hypothetical protein